MDFSDLKTELEDRGFSDLTPTRAGRYINAARAELDRMYLWPWREKSGTGTAPLTVSDLGVVEAVVNTSQSSERLPAAQYRHLLDTFGDLSTDGRPECYYIAWPNGVPVVATYPESTDTIGVQYWKITADLVDDADEPASPTETHYLIVDLAARRAMRDVNNHEGAEAIQSEVDRQLAALLAQYAPGFGDFQGHTVVATGDW